jgi:hypothetical protein
VIIHDKRLLSGAPVVEAVLSLGGVMFFVNGRALAMYFNNYHVFNNSSDFSKNLKLFWIKFFRQFSTGNYGHLDVATPASFAQIDADCQKGALSSLSSLRERIR